MFEENSSKKMDWKVVGIAGAAVLLLAGMAKSKTLPKPPVIPANLVDLHQQNLDNKTGVQSLLGEDKSPEVSVFKSDITTAQIVTLSQSITTRWADRIQAIANNLNVAPSSIGAGLAVMMAIPDAVIREKTLSYYIQLVELWSKLFASTLANVSKSITELAIDTNNAIQSSNTCLATLIMRNVDDQSTYDTNTITKTTIETGNTNVLLSILVDSSSGKTTQVTDVVTTQRDSHKVTLIPYCAQSALDVTKLDAILGASTMSLTILYAMLQKTINLLPNPKNFV